MPSRVPNRPASFLSRTRNIALAGLFAAFIFVATYWLHIPTANGGYIHVGDAFVYLSACFLPLPYAMAASGIGEALSDALSPGAMFFAPFTLVIKMLLVLWFSRKTPQIVSHRNLLATVLAGLTGLAGYYVPEAIAAGNNFLAPLFLLPMDALQPIFSGVVFVLVGLVFDKIHLRSRLTRF